MNKSTTKQQIQKMSIYFPLDVLEAVRDAAKKDKRSFNAEVLWIIQQYLEQQEQQKKL
jgi:hypothetical protein